MLKLFFFFWFLELTYAFQLALFPLFFPSISFFFLGKKNKKGGKKRNRLSTVKTQRRTFSLVEAKRAYVLYIYIYIYVCGGDD